MANYATLKTAIQSVIKQNGNNEITGEILQQALLSIINSLGAGYQYIGVAMPDDAPGTPDQKVFYFAKQPGTYTNFGGIVVNSGEWATLKYDSAWHKEIISSDLVKLIREFDFISAGTFTKQVKNESFVQFYSGEYVATNGNVGTVSGWGYYYIPVTPGMVFDLSAYAGQSIRLWVQRSGSTAVAVSSDSSAVGFKHETITIQDGVDNLCVNARIGSQSEIDLISILETYSGIDWNAVWAGTQSLPAYLATVNNADIVNDIIEAVFGERITFYIGQYYSDSDGTVGNVPKLARTDKIDIDSFDEIIMNQNALGYNISKLYSWDENGNYLGYNAPYAYSLTAKQIKIWRPTAYKIALGLYGGTDLTVENTADWLLFFSDNGLLKRMDNAETAQDVTDTEFDQLQDTIFGPIYRGIVLGSYFSNSDGEPSNYGAFARTGKIDITTIDKLVFGENELNYYILTFFAWDANGNFLGYHYVNGNSVTREYMAGFEPNAVTVGFNFYSASPVTLTPGNTADWLFYAPETGILQRLDNLEFEQETKPNSIELSFAENAVSTIRSPFNDNYDIVANLNVKRNDVSRTRNPVFSYNGVALINKNTQQSVLVHSCTDDIAPANYNGTYIGGNHGDSDVCVITASGHGKTYVDIGSKWTDGTNQCTIVGIVNANQLLVLGENTAQYPIFRFNKTMFASGVTLTHVSGATHAGNIAITAVSSTQWWPATSVAAVRVFADGKEITTNGKYNFNHLNICEQYDVYNPASILEKIQAGVGTFTSNPAPNQFPTADKVVRHSIVYGFDGADKWTVSVDFIAYQDIQISYYGFTQQAVLDGSNIKMYIPKTLPIVAGGTTFDFRSLIAYNSLSEAINLTGSYWENPNLPPDRWLQTSENIALHSGYLFDYGVGGENRKDNISNSFYLYTSRKCYPHGIDSKITVHAGDVFSAVVWRTYLDLANINTNGILAQNAVEYKNGCYLYADFTAAGMYQIDIPEKFVGKKISVFEKSANVEMLAQLSNTKILVKVTTASPMYGYLVAKIDE